MEQERLSERQGARVTVASYQSYADAQRAVDYLADENFPVERVAIVAEGMRIVEQVTGKLSIARVGLNGALSGAFIGLLVGLLFSFLDLTAPFISILNLALWGLIVGAVIGGLLSAVVYAMSGGDRDFSSVSSFQADRYNVLVDADVADEAGRLIGTLA